MVKLIPRAVCESLAAWCFASPRLSADLHWGFAWACMYVCLSSLCGLLTGILDLCLWVRTGALVRSLQYYYYYNYYYYYYYYYY
jgi:hypothetical protein